MQMIMSNPTERDLIRMRRDAEIDQRTVVNAAVNSAIINTLAELVKKGLLSVDNAAMEANMSVKEFKDEAGLK